MKKISGIYLLVSIVMIVFLSDLIQYLLIFPDKLFRIILVFGAIGVLAFLAGVYLSKEPIKFTVIKVMCVLLVVFSGVQQRVFSANELLIDIHQANSVLSKLKPELSAYVKQHNTCPASYTEIVQQEKIKAFFAMEAYTLVASEAHCFLIAKEFGKVNLKHVQQPNESNLIYFKNSAFWTFLLNDLIYALSNYEDKQFTIGIKIPLIR